MIRVILVLVVLVMSSCSVKTEPGAVAEPEKASQQTEKPSGDAVKKSIEVKTEASKEPSKQSETKKKPAAEPETVALVKKPKPHRIQKPLPVVPEVRLIGGKRVIGGVEAVRIIPGDFVLPARIDTGAKTSSLHAEELELFERDGKRWVRFRLAGGNKSRVVEKKVVRMVRIKQQNVPSERRPVIKMRFIIGGVSQSIQVTLTDRSNFKYKVLVGRNFLHDVFIVDVGQKMTVQPMPYRRR
jgi:hypothetical protein